MLLYLVLGSTALLVTICLWWFLQTRQVQIAPYEVVERDGDIEIRNYPALVVAEVTRRGTRDQAVRAGFPPLARYIFAREREGGKIAMTAPVTQTGDDETWTIRFIMPEGYGLEQLPKPAGTDVRLTQLPPARRAAIRFSGWWSDELFAQENSALLKWLAAKDIEPLGAATFAYYNDPFTPGFLRRNEILYDLAP